MPTNQDHPSHHQMPRPPIGIELSGGFTIDISVNIYHHAVPGKDDPALRAMTRTLSDSNQALTDAMASLSTSSTATDDAVNRPSQPKETP